MNAWPLSVSLSDANLDERANSGLFQATVSGSEAAATLSVPADLEFSWSDGHLEITKRFKFSTSYVVQTEVSAKLDGKPITAEHGGPVRGMVPQLYAWKSAKWIQAIELVATAQPGFWEERGYHLRGSQGRNNFRIRNFSPSSICQRGAQPRRRGLRAFFAAVKAAV